VTQGVGHFMALLQTLDSEKRKGTKFNVRKENNEPDARDKDDDRGSEEVGDDVPGFFSCDSAK
jgi:hypothetical protein